MKAIKKSAFLCMVVILCMLLSGCSLLSTGEELLRAPKSGGEVSEIKEALKELITGDYTLKYPTDGDYRSAIVRYDIDGDGEEEAIAFYSTTAENITNMHIAVLSKTSGRWKASKDAQTLASGVEKVTFCDLNADGKNEIIVGWSVLGTVDKQVSVYSFDGTLLLQRAEEKYTEFLCCDLDTDQKNELLVIHLNTSEQMGTARLLEITDAGVNERASVPTNGTISGYQSVSVSKLLDGKTAVYLDGKKGSGLITEILFLSGENLLNPMFDIQNGTTLTERPFTDGVRDINGDGSPDIPMHGVAPGFENMSEGEREYITKWCAYNGKGLVVTLTSITDTADGYYVEIPKPLQDKVTLLTTRDGKIKTVSLYDTENKKKGDVLFKVKETRKEDYTPEDGWVLAAENAYTVLTVQVSGYGGAEARTAEEIAKTVKFFEQGEKSK